MSNQIAISLQFSQLVNVSATNFPLQIGKKPNKKLKANIQTINRCKHCCWKSKLLVLKRLSIAVGLRC